MSYYNDYVDDLLVAMLGESHPYNKQNKAKHMAQIKIDEKAKTVTITLPLLETHAVHPNTISVAETRNENLGVKFQDQDMKVTAQVYYKNPTPFKKPAA